MKKEKTNFMSVAASPNVCKLLLSEQRNLLFNIYLSVEWDFVWLMDDVRLLFLLFLYG